MRISSSILFRSLAALALLAGLGWVATATWQLRQARRAARAVAGLLTVDAARATTAIDPLSLLRVAAPSLHDGDFQGACDLLAPRALNATEQEAARRFLASRGELRGRFLAAAATAQRSDAADETARARTALSAALCAAADGNASCLQASLASAEQTLDASLPAALGPSGDSEPRAVARLAQAIAPALNLGRELMTESYGPAERLVARASSHYRRRQYAQAAVLLQLAGQLLGAPASAAAADDAPPPWFTAMTERPSEGLTAAQSRAIVSFCEAVAGSQALSPAVTAMVRQARRERDAGRLPEARWWASVAIEALGMTDEAALRAAPATEAQP